MIKYQYQTITVSSGLLDKTLNEKGNQGWRLISIVHKSIKTTCIIHQYECVFEKIIM